MVGNPRELSPIFLFAAYLTYIACKVECRGQLTFREAFGVMWNSTAVELGYVYFWNKNSRICFVRVPTWQFGLVPGIFLPFSVAAMISTCIVISILAC